MKKIIIVLFIIFILWMITAIYLLNINHEKAKIVMGLAVMFMSFILMPLFIYDRYKDGKYKKYIIDNTQKDSGIKKG